MDRQRIKMYILGFLETNIERLVKRAEEDGEASSLLVIRYMDLHPIKTWNEILNMDEIHDKLKESNKKYSASHIRLSLSTSSEGYILRAYTKIF